jgi:Zinc-binding domain of primase-helicase
MAGYYKAEEVRAAANGKWADVLGWLGVNTALLENKHGPCPGCGGNDRFRWDDKGGEGTWLCSQGGGGTISGDGLALLMHVTGKEWKDCLQMVGEQLLGAGGQHATRDPGVNAGVVKNAPKQKETWVPDFSLNKLRGVVFHQMAVSPEWFMERSPVDVRRMTPGEFIEHIYQPGERVLVFTDFRSQGDYLWEVGRGGYRLADSPGVAAVKSNLPVDGGKEGVWFLNNPVDGQWHGNPRAGGKPSRRSMESVKVWKYLLLESDEAPADLWLRLLACCGLPIVAIYSSGGRSWHALVREDHGDDMAGFKEKLKHYKRRMPWIGADANAITPVRLTRLPMCTRSGNLQKLIYCNPAANGEVSQKISDNPKIRNL